MTLSDLQLIGDLILKASVVAWFCILSRRLRVAQLPALSKMPASGPYRTSSTTDQAIETPRSVDEMTRAIDDATARLNEQLRAGKISAYAYGEEISWLTIATRKTEELKKRMRGDG